MLTWRLGLGLEGQTEGCGLSFESDGGPMLECKDQAGDLAHRSEVRVVVLEAMKDQGGGDPNPGRLPWAPAGSRLSSSDPPSVCFHPAAGAGAHPPAARRTRRHTAPGSGCVAIGPPAGWSSGGQWGEAHPGTGVETKDGEGEDVACGLHPRHSEGRACLPHPKTGTVCGRGRSIWSPAGAHLGSWGCC